MNTAPQTKEIDSAEVASPSFTGTSALADLPSNLNPAEQPNAPAVSAGTAEAVDTATPSSTPSDKPPAKGLGSTFYTIWVGQFISAIGTAMTSFALGVWLFQRTGSVMDFANMLLFGTLPALLLTPWAGSIADNFDKRKILIAGESVSLICVSAIGILVWKEAFEVWHLWLVQIFLSVSMAFQAPAAYAAISSIVDKSQFGRVGGMFSLARAVSQLGAPMIAATLLALIGLPGIIVMDVITFWCSLSTLFLISLPAIPPRVVDPAIAHVSKWLRPLNDFKRAIVFLLDRPAMSKIYGYMTLGSFLTGMVAVLVTPMVLSAHSAQDLALITTCGSLGVMIGSLLMIVTGGPKQWTRLIMLLNVVEGLAVALGGYTTRVWVLCMCSFIALMCGTVMAACVQSVWRRKVPRDNQGSISAFQQAVTLSMVPLSAILGGFLAHNLFEPGFMPGGMFFDSVGVWFGSGKGRGTGFFFVIVGVLVTVVSLYGLVLSHMHKIEKEVPDLI